MMRFSGTDFIWLWEMFNIFFCFRKLKKINKRNQIKQLTSVLDDQTSSKIWVNWLNERSSLTILNESGKWNVLNALCERSTTSHWIMSVYGLEEIKLQKSIKKSRYLKIKIMMDTNFPSSCNLCQILLIAGWLFHVLILFYCWRGVMFSLTVWWGKKTTQQMIGLPKCYLRKNQ